MFITEEKLKEAYNQPFGTLLQFIKSIFGKHRFKSHEQEISESFDAFMIAHNYNTDQTRFLRVIKNVFLSRIRRQEPIKIDDFYEGPAEAFGVDAADRYFRKDEIDEIIDFFEKFKKKVA